MARIKSAPVGCKLDVWCRDCRKVITVEEPQDLHKQVRPGDEHPMFCLTCPDCGREIWLDGIIGHALSQGFIDQAKTQE